MLTVFALNNAKQAAKYYEEDNYYHKGSVESIAATHWWGKGAEILGLSDYVDPEKFVEMLQGKIDENTILERIRHDGGVGHKPGYDLTFSAPKSVSMLVEIGKDYRIYDAHNKAVNTALEYLQSRIALYRHTVDSHTQVKQSDNLIVAKFRHDTSRSVEDTIDCQLHTHCVVLNATMCEDGQWRSLFEKPIFDFKMVGGMIYRSALAKELKEIGYKIEKTREDGLFEVAGFSRDQIEAFSKRRVKILEVMNELGLFGAEAAQSVTLGLRENKTPIDREKLEAHWQGRAQELGINLSEIVEVSLAREKAGIKDIVDPEIVADKALQYSIDHLGERQSVFQEKDIIRTSLQYALGDIQVEDVHRALERYKAEEKLVYLGQHKHSDLYTSPKIIEQENRIIEIMKNGKNEFDAIASKEAVDFYIKDLVDSRPEGAKPTECQLKAIEFLSTSTDRVVGVQGYAGTGKTTMLKAVCRIAEQAGYQIRGAAPSASAADVLRTDTGITTETLSGLLLDLYKEKPPKNLSAKPELIILDEASMASTHQMHDLTEMAEKLNKRIFLTGDRQQLPSVENGAPFGLLQDEGMSTTTLTQTVRQEAKDLVYAVRETIHGDVGYAIQAIGHEAFIERNSDGEAVFSPGSTVNVIESKDRRLEAIANAYLGLNDDARDNTIVLLGSNEDRRTVNQLIRDGLKEKGVIAGRELHSVILQSKGMTAIERTHIYNYEVGDIVRFNKAYRSLGIKRYDYLTVIGIDSNSQELILDRNGREVRWKPETSAKSKGGAVEVFAQDERSLTAGDYIRWTQNKKNQDIYNTETAQVMSVLGDVARVKLRNGKLIDLDLSKSINSHWDYAWSSTVYAAQGKKARNVIAQLEGYNPNLTNYRAFYVTLSRAVNSIHLYVDDLDKAIKTIKEHTGEKSNATEFLIAHKEKHQFEQYIKTAYLKLDGNIHEESNELERLVNLSKHYVSFDNPKSVHLIAVDFKDRMRLNALIREELKSKNKIASQDFSISALRKYRIRSNDDRMKLDKGMLVGFGRGYKKYGIKKGDYFTVSEIRELENKAVLKNSTGKEAIVDIPFIVSRQDKEIEVCKLDHRKLAAGDEITWTKTYKKDGIFKGQQANVREITEQEVTIELSNHRTVTFNKNDPRAMYWNYAYAKSIDDPTPKRYEVGLAHLDERTKSPARISAIFGAMGKAEHGAHVYTHSKDYVVSQLRRSAEQDINLKPYDEKDVKKDIYEALKQFEESKKTVSRAWITYFEKKKAGIETDDNLRNALILDRAHAELADQIITDKDFDRKQVSALGLDINRIQKYADKHKVIDLVNHYEQSNGVMRGHYAKEMASHITHFSNELATRGLDKEKVLEESWEHTRRLERLKLNVQERKDSRMVEAYFEYGKEARSLWKKVYQAKDRGVKPDQSQFSFANHVSKLRNELAKEIVTHPERFDKFISHLQPKTYNLIKNHAQKYEKTLERESRRGRAIRTKDWRQVVDYDQKHFDQERSIQYQYANEPKKIYWDKDLVLREIMGKAEQILSDILEEEKNTRLSRGNKIVWGKKHGSVHFHLSGSKEGVVNDYERGVHGDIINYYAKRRGIDWYDSLSELAAVAGLDPSRAAIKPISITPEQKAKKEKAILEEQKRRQKMRQLAQKTWDEAKPIKGTLVERYLKDHRGMDFDVSKLEVRYHLAAPNIISYKDDAVRVGERRPAMVVSFVNDQEELTGIQCTYLDKNSANKDKSVKIGKCTIGQVWGSSGLIYRGGDEKVIVGEGAETSASLVPVEPKSSIYITGGNMQNVGGYAFLAKKHDKKELHIAADNDLSFESGSWKATEAGAKQLAKNNVKPLVSKPEVIKGEKTDYNDVYKRYGKNEVKKQFKPTFTIDEKQPVTDETKLTPILQEKAINPLSVESKEQLYKIPDHVPGITTKLPQKQKDDRQLGERG